MQTANIILSIALIALMGLAAYLSIRYLKKASELDDRKADLDQQEIGIKKRDAALDLWEKQLRTEAKRTAKTVHVFANKSVEDPNDEAPDVPVHAVYKKLASQFGYAAASRFKDCITRKHDGTKTTYSLDLNIYPYDL